MNNITEPKSSIEPRPEPGESIESLIEEKQPKPKKKPKIQKEKLLSEIEKKQTPKVGRPLKDSKLWSEDMVEPVVQQISATVGRLFGEKWALEQSEVTAWTKVGTPLLNKYLPETSNALEWNALLILTTYVTSRLNLFSVKTSADESK